MDDPFWFKDAVIYELHVRSFYDSDNDGYGDFAGLRDKLPYLEQLGVNTLWLLPFFQSPLRDDGYDIADYTQILPVHGGLTDFQAFLAEAHSRGMRVLIELVLNHTSDQHAWFQEARDPTSPKHDWYVWSPTSDRYREARIIFQDFEHSNWSWDPKAQAYYWHRFFAHQPDLNWDNPEVEAVLLEVVYYWLDMGVDGLRLDAIPYLYEREGTSCENLPETLSAVRRLRAAIESRYGPGKVLLAEANQWPEDVIPYFGEGEGDGVHMSFNFPLMPRVFMGLRREDRGPIVEMLELTDTIPAGSQWAIFLRNHDELTLEMVTDEERDVMYHEYAADPQYRINLGINRRLTPLLGGERRRIELLYSLLLSLKGSPVLYYGDEIGMGDNQFLGDRNGVRTPMQWSSDKNAGFSRAPFHRLFLPPINEGPYSYDFVNVEDASQNPHSLLNFVRRILALRNQHAKTFGRGKLTVLPVENRRVLAYLREYEGETILVVANLSRFAQAARLPLGGCLGKVPVELFSRADFPAVAEGDYPLTLGPHGFYWFVLQPAPALEGEEEEVTPVPLRKLTTLSLQGGIETLLIDTLVQGTARDRLEKFLPEYLGLQRWFGTKDQKIEKAWIQDAIKLPGTAFPVYLAQVGVRQGNQESRYFLPLGVVGGETAQEIMHERPLAPLVWLKTPAGKELLFDATASPEFWSALWKATTQGFKGRSLRGSYLAQLLTPVDLADPAVRVLKAEQSNSSAVLGGQVFAKTYRRLSEGVNPELELLQHLTSVEFPYVPHLLGSAIFRRGKAEAALAIFQEFIPGDSDAWSFMLAEFHRYLLRVADSPRPAEDSEADPEVIPGWLEAVAGEIIEFVRRIGVRTGELHLALATGTTPALAPEPVVAEDLAAWVNRLKVEAERSRESLIAANLTRKPAPSPTQWDHLLAQIEASSNLAGEWQQIRVHGDYHLGQLLVAAGEIYILDFEGEPARPTSERRQKDHALRDVAGMLRSLEYVGLMAFKNYDGEADLEAWTWDLIDHLQRAFLGGYHAATEGAPFLPPAEIRNTVLWLLLLEKALYELRYELAYRPDWVGVPLRGIRRLAEVS